MTIEVNFTIRKHNAKLCCRCFCGTAEIWSERSNQTQRHREENERKHVATTRGFCPFPCLLGPSLFWEGSLPRPKSVQDRPLRFRFCLFVYRRKNLVVSWLVLDDCTAYPLAMYSHKRNRNHLFLSIFAKKTSTLWVFQAPCHHPERWPLGTSNCWTIIIFPFL